MILEYLIGDIQVWSHGPGAASNQPRVCANRQMTRLVTRVRSIFFLLLFLFFALEERGRERKAISTLYGSQKYFFFFQNFFFLFFLGKFFFLFFLF